jgi:hypothetical protein
VIGSCWLTATWRARSPGDDVDASDLMRLMAGGEEFSALTDALTALPSEFGDR